MHLWIDIDNPNHIPFIHALVNELKSRSHSISLTSVNSSSIPETLEENKLDIKKIGQVFSFFGLLMEPTTMFRAILLSKYIENRNIDIAFSLGSKSMLYSSAQLELPIILFLTSLKEKPHIFYFIMNKSSFLVSENIPDQMLIDKGYDLNKLVKFKGNVTAEDINVDLKVIKDIANKIEFLSGKLHGELTA